MTTQKPSSTERERRIALERTAARISRRARRRFRQNNVNQELDGLDSQHAANMFGTMVERARLIDLVLTLQDRLEELEDWYEDARLESELYDLPSQGFR